MAHRGHSRAGDKASDPAWPPRPRIIPTSRRPLRPYRSRFMGGPLSAYETWMLYAAEIGHWKIRGFGMWMIHDKATDEALGMAGGWQPAAWPEREIAWIVFPAITARATGWRRPMRVAAIFTAKGGTGRSSYLDPKDLDSVRLAERLGAKRDADAKTIDDNDSVYRHPTPAALKSSQLSDGITLEIAHYADPKFTPEGWALD